MEGGKKKREKEKEGQRDREREKERETDRQRERKGKRERQTERERERESERERGQRERKRETERETEKEKEREKGRERGKINTNIEQDLKSAPKWISEILKLVWRIWCRAEAHIDTTHHYTEIYAKTKRTENKQRYAYHVGHIWSKTNEWTVMRARKIANIPFGLFWPREFLCFLHYRNR